MMHKMAATTATAILPLMFLCCQMGEQLPATSAAMVNVTAMFQSLNFKPSHQRTISDSDIRIGTEDREHASVRRLDGSTDVTEFDGITRTTGVTRPAGGAGMRSLTGIHTRHSAWKLSNRTRRSANLPCLPSRVQTTQQSIQTFREKYLTVHVFYHSLPFTLNVKLFVPIIRVPAVLSFAVKSSDFDLTLKKDWITLTVECLSNNHLLTTEWNIKVSHGGIPKVETGSFLWGASFDKLELGFEGQVEWYAGTSRHDCQKYGPTTPPPPTTVIVTSTRVTPALSSLTPAITSSVPSIDSDTSTGDVELAQNLSFDWHWLLLLLLLLPLLLLVALGCRLHARKARPRKFVAVAARVRSESINSLYGVQQPPVAMHEETATTAGSRARQDSINSLYEQADFGEASSSQVYEPVDSGNTSRGQQYEMEEIYEPNSAFQDYDDNIYQN